MRKEHFSGINANRVALSMSRSEDLSINVRSVLWRTAGINWDYDIILVPATVDQKSWYWFHRSVFKSISPEHTPKSVVGVMSDEKKSYPFVATAFLDLNKADLNGRPIQHFLVWFHNGSRRDVLLRSLPKNWGQQLVTGLAEQYEEIYKAPEAPGSIFLDSIRDKTIYVSPANDENRIEHCEDIGTLKKNKDPEGQGNDKSPTTPIIALVSACLVIFGFIFFVKSCDKFEHETPTPMQQQK